MLSWLTSNLIWTEGLSILCILALVGGIASCFFRWARYGTVVAFLFCFFFFRNPDRVCIPALTDPTVLVCPADGWVVGIEDLCIKCAPYTKRVSIFLTPFDVHVTWSPCQGLVEEVAYHAGEFSLAFLPKSSDKNERNDVVLQSFDGRPVKVRQIAGSIARTIVCWARPGQGLVAGEKFGMIKFGSRVDLFLPEHVEISVTQGQRVKGGETVLGHWR